MKSTDTIYTANSVFTMEREMLEVTSLRRPDPSWVHFDSAGHEHRWYDGESPMKEYRPDKSYRTPTLFWVEDPEVYMDGTHMGHLICLKCGEIVIPGYTADDTSQYVTGMTYCLIDGKRVTLEEFKRRLVEQSVVATDFAKW